MTVGVFEPHAPASQPSTFWKREWRSWAGFPARTAWLCGAYVALIALFLIGGAHHVPWFDEAQAWVIARDTSPSDIINHVARYEGTPALWHLLLWTSQRLGLQYADFHLVSSTLAAAGAALVLFRSPFPTWMRVGIIFSYFFCFQYAVIARSYAIDLFLIPAAAVFFHDRLRHPLLYCFILGALANTNAHSFVIAGVLALELCHALYITRKVDLKVFAALSLYGGLALFAAYQAAPPSDPNFASAAGIQFMAARPVILLLEGLIERANFIPDPGHGLHIFPSGMLLTLLILIPTGFLSWKAGRGWLFFAIFASLVTFLLLIYSNYWHSGVFFLSLIFCLWINWSALTDLRADRRIWLIGAVAVLLIYQDSYSAMAWSRDLEHPYSAGKTAASALAKIMTDHPSDRVAAVGFKTFAVQPFFAKSPFANGPAEASGAFFHWRRHGDVPLYASPDEWRRLVSSKRYDWLVLAPDNPEHDFDLRPYTRWARDGGYCITDRFPGDLVWKTRLVEPDNIVFFGRCGRR